VLLPQAMPNTLRTLALVVTGVVVYGAITVWPQLGRMRRLLGSLREDPTADLSTGTSVTAAST